MSCQRYALHQSTERREFHRDPEKREIDPGTDRAKTPSEINKGGLGIPVESGIDGLFSAGGERNGGLGERP